MKRRVRQLALLLAAVMLLSVTALAADDNDKATITDELTGATATFDTSNSDIINVTFTSSSLVNGNQYLILMIKGTSDGSNFPTITEDSILYIDQTEAANQTISFDVYPSSIQDSVILITGVDGGPLVAAIVNAKYILGDVNGDGEVNASDVVRLAQYFVGNNSISGAEAADTTGDGELNSADLIRLARFLVGTASLG